jgi:sugar-specific transcriptional regulator TrmB
MSSADHLMRLGLNKNEARALDALLALGPSGASDVHRQAGMPRNKAYEALERLANRGMVEVQNGRPTLYRATGAKAIIDSLVEGYGVEAREALKTLQLTRDETAEEEESNEAASAWMVRGSQGVRRRLAELLYGARSDIFCIFGYPPKHLLPAKAALKAAAGRGVKTRAVCMIRPADDPEVSADDAQVIEFRTVKGPQTLGMKMQPHDEKLIGSFANMQGNGGMVIIDESVAFDIVDDGKSPKSVAGIVFKAPGIPRIQKATVERILALYTRKL